MSDSSAIEGSRLRDPASLNNVKNDGERYSRSTSGLYTDMYTHECAPTFTCVPTETHIQIYTHT